MGALNVVPLALLVACGGATVRPGASGAGHVAHSGEVEGLRRENDGLRARLRAAAREHEEVLAMLALARAEARDARAEHERAGAQAREAERACGARRGEANRRRDRTDVDAREDGGDEPPIVLTDGGESSPREVQPLGANTLAASTERLPIALVPAVPRAQNQDATRVRVEAAPAPSAQAPPVDRDPILAAYRSALGLVRDRRFSEAVSRLSTFLREHATHPYADNALYWRGEALYAQAQFPRALDDFEEVIARYPEGNKVADALFKIGQCYLRLGRANDARTYFERLRGTYPDSSAARSLPEVQP